MYSYLYTHILGIFFMADNISMDQLRQFFVDIFASSRDNSGPKADMKDMGKIADVAKEAEKVLGPFAQGAGNFLTLMKENLPQLATGFLGVVKASEAFTTSLTTLAGYVPGFGTALGKAIGVLDQFRTVGNEANKIGVGQLDTARLQLEAQKAGFNNAQEYIQFLSKTAGNSLKNLAGSNELSSQKFLKFAEKVQDQKLVKDLKGQVGMGPEEIARIAAVAAGGKTTQLDTAKGQEELAAKTATLANQINRLSQTSGKYREDIIAEMELRNKSARGQMELGALRNDAERDQYQKTQISINGMGKSMQDITGTIMAGGYLDPKAQTTLQVATGGRSGQYMRAVRDQRRTANLSDDDPAKRAAQKRLDDEIAKANAYQTSKQFYQRALTTQDPDQKAAAEQLQADNVEKAGQAAERRATGLSPEETRRKQQAQYGDALKDGKLQEMSGLPAGAPGADNFAARPAQVLNQAYEAARVNAIGATNEIKKWNDELGKSPEKLKPIIAFFELMFGPMSQTASEAIKRQEDNVKKVKNAVLPEQESAETKQKLEDEIKKHGLPTKNTRAHGTLGETGQVTEPKDIISKLHKGETVVTPEQLKNLLSGSASNAISEVMKSATNMPKEGGIDVGKITSGLKEITTTISSVTGGGSTTRSTVENDDAKAAKKELEAVKAQFQTEKNDIRAQVKSNLGPDAKHTDIMRAMRDNPQAKALEARMQEATAKLSERVNAGTTSKTVTEPGAKSVSITDIQKNMAQGMSQPEAQKKAELKADLRTSAPKELGINKEKISSPLTVFESMFDKLFSNKSKVDDTTKINNAAESSIDKIKINDATTPTIDSVSNKLADNKKELTADLDIEPEINQLDSNQRSTPVGLNDLNEQLIQLNTSIRQLIQHSAESVETAVKQVKATQGLSGNRFA